MAFELRPEKDFNIEKSRPTSRADAEQILWAHQDSEPQSPNRFFAMSTAVHVGLLLATAFISAPIIQQAQTETVTIEIESEVDPISLGAPVLATQGGASQTTNAPQASAPVQGGNELDGDDDIVITKPKARSSVAAKTPSAPKVTVSKAAGKSAPAAAPIAAIPATLSDIDDPTLDEALLKQPNVVKGFDDDLGEHFQDVDNKTTAKVASLANQIAADADEHANANDAFLNSLSEQNKNEAEEILAKNRALRAKDYAGIAAAQKAEEQAARARAAAAAAAAAKANLLGRGQALAGQGAGNNGSLASGSQLAGSPQGVRQLDQLRQMPGNPTPQYATDERLSGHQGNVVFHAYVGANGNLLKFKQVSTTGYANLDEKTLKALKQWRFYPGQEGWVELPFAWSLKGGAKAVDGRLRSKSAMR